MYMEQPGDQVSDILTSFSFFLAVGGGLKGGAATTGKYTRQTITPAQSQSTVAGGSWAIVLRCVVPPVGKCRPEERKEGNLSQSVSRWIVGQKGKGNGKMGEKWHEWNARRSWMACDGFRRCPEICISHARRWAAAAAAGKPQAGRRKPSLHLCRNTDTCIS